MSLNPDLWDLSYHDGELHWNDCLLKNVADQFHTPLYVVNEARLKKDIDRFVTAVQQHIPNNEIYYSFKTSGVPELTHYFNEANIGAEVVTGHELELASRLGVPSSKIIFGGTNKRRDELQSAIDAKIKLIIIDVIDEGYLLKNIANVQQQQINIALRISFDIHPRNTFYINKTSASSNHLGFDPDSNEFREALRIIKNDQHLNLIGLHSHIGTGLRDINAFSENVEKLFSLYVKLRGGGFPLECIDIGGGLGVATVKEFSPFEFIRYAVWGKMPSEPKVEDGLMDTYIKSVASTINSLSKKYQVESPRIIFEPGRILTSNAVLLLLKVGAIRKRSNKSQFALVDGGSMSVGMSCLAEYHEVFNVTKTSELKECYTIIGRVPTPLDIIYKNKILPKLSADEYIAVMDAGAYLIPTATSFASMHPGIVSLSEGTSRLIRRHESVDDLLSRSIIDV